MTWLTTTLGMYGGAFRRAGELTLRTWPVAGTTFAYALALASAAAPNAASSTALS